MANFGSAVVVHLTTYPKIGGSNLAGAWHKKKMEGRRKKLAPR
jgi:hypothetical protein